MYRVVVAQDPEDASFWLDCVDGLDGTHPYTRREREQVEAEARPVSEQTAELARRGSDPGLFAV